MIPRAPVGRVSRRDLLRGLAASCGLLGGATLLAACGPSPSAAPPPAATSGAATTRTSGGPPAATRPGGQVSVFWPKPVTFNPLFSTAGAEQGVEQLLLGALVKVNDKLEAVPDIAEKIDVSSDARTYTFHLKNALKFTDRQSLAARKLVRSAAWSRQTITRSA